MTNPNYESPYDIIETIKTEYRKGLKEKLVGIYLHGSLAMGCFHPNISDIDFLVIVNERLRDEGEGETFSEGMMAGFRNGLLVAMIFGFTVYIIKYRKVMNDDKQLRLAYNKENDERRQQMPYFNYLLVRL